MRIRKVAQSPWTGAIGALLSIGWEAFWLIGPPIGIDNANRRSYLVWGLLALAITAVQTFTVQRLRIRELEVAMAPKLEILFEPKNDEDSRPYLQTLAFQQLVEVPSFRSKQVAVNMIDRRYRVGVRNLSTVVAPDVALLLQSCQPGGNFVFPEHRFAVQDTNPPDGVCDIPAGQTRWFDVVNELSWVASKQPAAVFHLCYQNPDFQQLPVPAGTYDIVVRADGGGASVTRSFQISKIVVDGKSSSLRFRAT